MPEGSPSSDFKVSKRPEIQAEVEEVSKNLTQLKANQDKTPKEINQQARSLTAYHLMINRVRERLGRQITAAEQRAQTAEDLASQHKSDAEEARAKTMYDETTGLHNDVWFKERFERAIREFERTGKSFYIMMMDVDNFKPINSRFTHPGADNILRIFAQIPTRPDEEIARYHGDEFLQLLNDDIDQTQAIKAAIRNANKFKSISEDVIPKIPVADPNTPDFSNASISIGLVEYSHGMDFKALSTAASAAMLEGKKFEKGNITISGRDGSIRHFQSKLDGDGNLVELFSPEPAPAG